MKPRMRWYWRAIIACLTVTMLLKLLTILSLIGLLLSVGLWGVSYFRFACYLGDDTRIIRCYEGQIEYYFRADGFRYIPLCGLVNRDYEVARMWGFAGFDGFQTKWWPTYRSSPTNSYRRNFAPANIVVITVPCWPLTFLSGVFVIVYTVPSARRRKRKKLGMCVKCGYDLRASKERCPECGTSIEE